MITIERQRLKERNEVETYKKAIDASCIVAVTNAKGVITYVNDHFCKISKYSAEELIGHTHHIVNSNYHSKEFFYELWSTISAGKIWKGEIKNKAKDGTLYWVETTIVPFLGDDGKPERYVSIRSDITDRKLTKERKFQMLFDNSHEGLLLARPDGGFLEVNQAFCKMLGYSYDEFLKLSRPDITLPDDLNLQEGLRIRSKTGYYKGIVKFRRKDGTVIDAEISSAIYQDENGESRSYITATDITTKLKAEKALRASEQRLSSMVEHGKDIITLINADGSIKYRSPSYAHLLGYDLNKMGGHLMFDNVHPHDRQMLRQQFAQIQANPGASVKSQWRQLHADGSIRWMEGTGTNMLDNPDINAVVCNFRDITEHIEIKQELEKSNRELSRLFNSIEEVLYSANRNPFMLTQMSDACQKLYGYTSSEFFENSTLWYDLILPEDKHVIELMNKAFAKGENATAQYRIKHKNGSIKWVEATVTPTLNSEGTLIRIDGVNRDITEKKAADEALYNNEKKFRTLIENSKDGIVLTDKNACFVYVSPAVKGILGYEPEELIGKYAYEVIHADFQQSDIKEAFSEGGAVKPFASILLKVLHKSGEWRWIDASVSIRLDDPAVNAVVTNFRDVTEKKNAEEKLEQLNQSLEKIVKERTLQLEESNKALESFSSMVAHDLQAPLRVISGYTSMLKQDYNENLGTDGMVLLDTINKQIGQMTQLIADLLVFSRASNTTLKQEEVDFDEIVLDLSNHLCHTYSGSNVARIKLYKLGSSLCDTVLVRQVWSNLISNALKYSSKKETPEIEIGRIKKDNEVVYYVKDNGAGFDMKKASRLFQVFQRLHCSSEYEGTGLGLALVKSVITRHGGQVWAESEPGKGATFYFSLPE